MGLGGGCLGSRAALTSLGAQFGLERFKKRACERRCCSTQSRPPAAATLTALAAAAARATPEVRVAAVGTAGPRGSSLRCPRRGQERGAQLCRRPLSCRSPRSRVERASVGSNPNAALRLRPARGPLPGHHGHLLGQRALVLAYLSATGGRGQLAEARRAASRVSGTLSVRAGR